MPPACRLVIQVTKWPKDALPHARAMLPDADSAACKRAIVTAGFLDRLFDPADAIELVGQLMARGGRAHVAEARRVIVSDWGTRGDPALGLALVTPDDDELARAPTTVGWTSPPATPARARACAEHIIDACGGRASISAQTIGFVADVRDQIEARYQALERERKPAPRAMRSSPSVG